MSDPESEAPLSRIELLRLAQSLGVSDADVMTRAELKVAIESSQRPEPSSVEPHPATWVGVARRLLARVVERGLNLPDAAALIRGDTKLSTPPKAPPPVATVTLARIYAAQGHLPRAINTLDEVLESDPDHELARELRTQLVLRRDELLATAPEAPAPGAAEPSAGAPAEDGVPAPAPDAPAPAPDAPALAPDAPALAPDAPALAPDAPALAPDAPAPSLAPVDQAADAEQPASEPIDAAPFAPVVELAVTPAPEPDDSAAGELVAPAFDVVERQASAASGATARPDEGVPQDVPAAAERGAEPSTHSVLNGAAPNGVAHPAEPSPAPAAEANEETAASAGRLPARSPGAELPGVANGGVPAPEPTPALPEAPGLVLIETDSGTRYLYWEVAAAGFGSRFWIHVVTHVPGSRGQAERRERRFPVYRRQGALRLEGLPARAVVRARLTGDADEDRSLVVAGTVKQQAAGAGGAYRASYAPFAAARPELIARRAASLLERASPVYWD